MKRKVIVDREKLSSEQVNAKMNFNSVLSKVSPVPFYKTGWFITTLASVAVIISVTLVAFNSPEEKQKDNTIADNSLSSPPPEDNNNFDYDEDTKCFNPPVKELEIPFEKFNIDNSKENILTTSMSTQIVIPKNAMTDQNGAPIVGTVEIKVREFHTPVDIYLSGIPMKYDSAGNEFTFESCGMIEIYGFQNGQPIEIEAGKAIEIKFEEKDKNTALNLYDFDTVANKWNYQGKPEFTAKPVLEAENNNETLVKEDVSKNHTLSVIPEENTTNQVTKEQVNEAKEVYETIKQENKKLKKESPKKPKTIENPQNVFTLNIDPKDFPEFSNYTNTKFEIDDANEWVNPNVFSTDWDNAILSQHQSKGNYLLTLSTKKEEEKIIVHPVLEGTDLAKAQQQFENDFKTYQTKLDKRIAAEEEAKAYYEEKKRIYEEQLKLQKQRALEIQKQQEIAAKQAKLYAESNTIKNQFTTTFKIKNFGTWNCDSPVKPPKGYTLNNDFLALDGSSIQLITVNVIELGKNAVFDFTGRQLKVNPREQSIVFGMTLDNKVAAITPTSLKRQINEKQKTLKLKVYENAKQAISEIKELVLG